jgi:hypothetical protein
MVERIFAIAEQLTRDGIPCPSAHDRARNQHRCGLAWSKSAVRAILANPRYTGRQVWNRQRCSAASSPAACREAGTTTRPTTAAPTQRVCAHQQRPPPAGRPPTRSRDPPELDTWLSQALDPVRIPGTIEALAASQDDAVPRELASLREEISTCEQKLAQYRAALDSGADPAVVGQWITETQARKLAADAPPARRDRHPPRAREDD